MKDWNGGYNSVFKTIGARNNVKEQRQSEDYYATDPMAVYKLSEHYELPYVICEPCCGEGHLAKELERLGRKVYASDIAERGFGNVMDFFDMKELPKDCNCILTNPLYKCALQVIKHALELLRENGTCIMFLKTTFLEGITRYNELYSQCPPRIIYQFSGRMICAKNGDFGKMRKIGSAVAYAWFIFQKDYKGETTIKWIL